MSVEYDSEAHEGGERSVTTRSSSVEQSESDGATTILVRPDGRALPHDSLDSLVRSIKLDMVSEGPESYSGHTIVSEEREVSISEIQEQFLAEDWSDYLPDYCY